MLNVIESAVHYYNILSSKGELPATAWMAQLDVMVREVSNKLEGFVQLTNNNLAINCVPLVEVARVVLVEQKKNIEKVARNDRKRL